MERKRKIKDGHIVVENPLFQELPTHEVTIKSGRTLYRFTGSYDGERSLPADERSRNYVKAVWQNYRPLLPLIARMGESFV